MIEHWIRFQHRETIHFGTIVGNRIRVFSGDMFDCPQATDTVVLLPDVTVLMPVVPTKVLAMWNNFPALGRQFRWAPPAEPLYLLKPPNAWLAPGGTICKPRGNLRVAFEGELAIVIGARCSAVGVEKAPDHIFGYTCANDVTAGEIIGRDPTFPQWVRAKGLDTFCPFGPVIATGLDPASLVVRTLLDGEVRQDYPVKDMVFNASQLVSMISQDMTLEPGDLILCGTSLGIGLMGPGSTVDVEIAGIGRLTNHFA